MAANPAVYGALTVGLMPQHATLVPNNNKVEWHVTLACDLDCHACTRASFLTQPHTASMTLEDAAEFIRQADALGWRPRVVIIGGEPTMHRDFEAFCMLAYGWTREAPQVFSNGTTEKARRRLEYVEKNYSTSICRDTFKTTAVTEGGTYAFVQPNAMNGWDWRTFVSPADAGVEYRGPCYMHASQICGVSVDHDGYAPCSPGGTIAALVAPEGRTKRLADLFDPEKVERMTDALCNHCGSEYRGRITEEVDRDVEGEKFEAYAADQPRPAWGTRMSPTWRKAFEGRK